MVVMRKPTIRRAVKRNPEKLPLLVWAFDKWGGFKFWFHIPFTDNTKEQLKQAIHKAREMNHSDDFPWLRDSGRIYWISLKGSRELIHVK
jgi:hypothetical protein